MKLSEGTVNTTYTVKGIEATESGMEDFLFSLGCYQGEPVTIISQLRHNMIISVKGSRYSIDSSLAQAITI